jgi:type IV pilus assembly protein PilM
MARGRIGLDIGSTAVRAAEVAWTAAPAVVRAAQVPLPAGAVESGEVRDAEAVAAALKELWHEGGFKARQVWMGIGNQRVFVREVVIPWLPDKELRASLPLQVQEFLPMSADEVVLDHVPVAEFEQEDRRMLRILLVAAQRTAVDAAVRAVQAARLEPLGLDLVPFALVRAVGTDDGALGLEEQGEEAIVDIGAHVTNIVVHARGTTRFVRIVPAGGRDIPTAVARAFGVDDELAERLKRGEPVGDQEAAEPPAPDEVRSVALTRAAAFVDEIRSSLEFYTAQAKDARIGRLLVTGGGSKLDGLLDVMRERIPLPVDPARVFEHVASQLSWSPEEAADHEPLLTVAVGLAIPGRDA